MPGHEMNGPEMDAAALGALIRDVPDWPVPGVVFKDLTPLLADATALRSVVAGMTDAAGAVGRIDRVAGIEARGFLLGTPVAYRLGVGFVPLRKPGKLPRATLSRGYALEYGTAELHVHSDAFAPGERVLVVDDVLATGGTAAAAVELVRLAGAEPVALSVLLELTALGGRALLPDALPVHALLSS